MIAFAPSILGTQVSSNRHPKCLEFDLAFQHTTSSVVREKEFRSERAWNFPWRAVCFPRKWPPLTALPAFPITNGLELFEERKRK
jgi:hypothetical protein